MPADILIYAAVAAGLVFWLRSLLGTQSGEERDRPNPFASRSDPLNRRALPAPGDAAAETPLAETPALGEGLDRTMSIATPAAEEGLAAIARADRSFALPAFLSGAQDAFVYVIESFAAGDTGALKDLLAPSVYAAFESVIAGRGDRGETASVEIHAIRRTEVLDAAIRDKTAFITVRFVADETSLLRDAQGDLIMGDPDRVTETIDIWTFGRPVNARSPVWLLHETREDAADTVPGSTVPGTADRT